MAFGKNLTEEEMKKMGTMARCCTDNIFIRVFCNDCKKLRLEEKDE